MSLSCAAAAAHAESFFQLEAGLGVSSAQKLGDGMYYSKGFSHDTPDGSYGGRIGVVMNVLDAHTRSFIPGARIHLDYENFGKVRWSSINPQDASDFSSVGQVGGYNQQTLACNDNNCGTLRKFDSTGGIQAISLTVEPYWDLGSGWQFGVEAGPALYRSTWTSTATALSAGPFGPAGAQDTYTAAARVRVGLMLGASISYKSFTLRYQHLSVPVGSGYSGTNVPPGITGEHFVSLNYTF